MNIYLMNYGGNVFKNVFFFSKTGTHEICSNLPVISYPFLNERRMKKTSAYFRATMYTRVLSIRQSECNQMRPRVSESFRYVYLVYKQHLIVCHSFTEERRLPSCELTNNDLEDHHRKLRRKDCPDMSCPIYYPRSMKQK